LAKINDVGNITEYGKGIAIKDGYPTVIVTTTETDIYIILMESVKQDTYWFSRYNLMTGDGEILFTTPIAKKPLFQIIAV